MATKRTNYNLQLLLDVLNRRRLLGPWVAGVLLFGILALSPAANAQDFKIIANPKVGDTQLTSQKLRLFYLGKLRKWSDGRKVVLTYQRDKKVLDKFARQTVSKTAFQFTTFWKRIVFTGKGAMPKSFKSEADLISYVRKTPGAIGFIQAETEAKDVVTIAITKVTTWLP